MPRRDGTGPMGAVSMTGRGLGICTGANAVTYRAGFGRGFGRCFGRKQAFSQISTKTHKELLNEEKTMLENRLEAIDEELKDL